MHPCTTSSSLRGARWIGSPRSLLCSVVCRWTHPQRDKGRLHRLLHDCDELLTQLAQVHFIAQRYVKSFERTRRIILAPKEAAIYACLDALAQGLEQCGNCKSGDHNGDVRGLTDESTQQELQRDDESDID